MSILNESLTARDFAPLVKHMTPQDRVWIASILAIKGRTPRQEASLRTKYEALLEVERILSFFDWRLSEDFRNSSPMFA